MNKIVLSEHRKKVRTIDYLYNHILVQKRLETINYLYDHILVFQNIICYLFRAALFKPVFILPKDAMLFLTVY